MKITAKSPANIAFIKYWGRADHDLFLPLNNNISMNMSGCMTTTTVEVDPELTDDEVEVKFYGKVYKQLDRDSIKAKNLYDQIERVRGLAKSDKFVRIKSENNFPADAGIAASASSFSAITAALLVAYDMKEKFDDKRELSRQIRLCGSSSANRSAMDGFVELIAGEDHGSTYTEQIADHSHWGLVDIVAIVDPEKKPVSSSRGHEIADTSPFLAARISTIGPRVEGVRQAILDRDLRKLGPLIEEDSTNMHAVMMTSQPPAYYWGPGSMRIMLDLMKWRQEDDLQAYFTLDAGPNVHVICEKKDAAEVQKRLEENEFVHWTIYNEPCEGTRLIDEHLF